MIYLDNAATTPVDPEVVQSMLPWFSKSFGNPSSRHKCGREAKCVIDKSRLVIANHLNCLPQEIIFTGCATESNNLAIYGISDQLKDNYHFITSAIEHKASIEPFKELNEKCGQNVSFLDIDKKDGPIDIDDLLSNIRDNTVMVSIMAVNNEIGSYQPVESIGKICNQRDLVFHCDATQAIGKYKIDVKKLGIDMLSMSAHKIYGPKGAGVLYVNKDLPIHCQLKGGSQEGGYRAGTQNVPGIVGLAKAIELCDNRWESDVKHYTKLCEILFDEIIDIPGIHIFGNERYCVPWICNFGFEDIDGGLLFDYMDAHDICISRSSACAKNKDPSHVLKSLGVPDELATCSIRVSFGRNNNKKDVYEFCRCLKKFLKKYKS